MSSSAFENIQYKASNGQVNLDEAQGIVECFVAGIGNKDSVGDICASGAFAKSLQRRKPRVVWGHNWNDPIGKVLEIYEVPVSDPRLPAKMKMAGIGGLYARVQFNLQSEKGREAFANVAFFGEEQEWSIGYKTIRAQYDQNLQANILYEVELYEVSPVLHGANQLTGTISVKSDEEKMHGMMPSMPTAPASQTESIFAEGLAKPVSADKLAMLVAELSRRAGGPIKVVEATENSVTFIKPNKGKFRISYHFNGSEYMFGKPELLQAAEDKPMESGPTPIQGVEAKPNAMKPKPAAVAMPMPVAMKPGENGMVIVPLPPVKYEGDSSDKEPVVVAEEQELADALTAIAERHGKFNEDGTGVWAGYTPASENENADIGVKCANCILYQGGGKCKIIAREVEPEGSCRFAVIPDNVVQVGDKKKRYMDAMDDSELDMVAELEEKYPGEFILGVVRGLAKRKRKRRASRLYKSLDQFGIEEAELESKGLDPFLAQESQYLIPVHPENAFEVKELLDPVLDYHRVDAFVNEDGIVISSGLNYEAKEALQNATKAAARRIGRSLTRGIGRSIGGRGMGMPGGDLDPRTRRDTDLDGTLFDGFPGWEQPDPTPSGPGSIDNPKPSRRQLTDTPSLSAGKRDVRRHATRTADVEKAIPDEEEDAKRAAHERIADKWEADGYGWSVVPKSGLYKNESSDFHRGIEIGHNQARLMWAGDENRKRPQGFDEKAKASNAYADWHMTFAQAASRYMDANKSDSDTWRGISTQLQEEVATKMPDMRNWDGDRRRDYTDSLNRLGFSSGKRDKKKTPRQSWNEASRQDFADRNILRSRKVPKKRREGPTAEEFSSGKKLQNLNDRNGEPFYVGNERITEEEMADVVREDEFGETVRDASFDEIVEVTGLSDSQVERMLEDVAYDGYDDGSGMSLDEAESFVKDDLIGELSTEEKLQIVLDKDFDGDKQALSKLIDEVFDRQLNDRIGAEETRREAGFGSGRRINTEGSSAIASANFDEENGTFDVEFQNGSRYRYSDVDAADVEAFEAADSKGRAFADFRKKYTAERLSGPRERAGMSSGRRNDSAEQFYSPANFSPEDNMKIVERMRGTSAFADLDEAQNNVDAEVRRMGRRVPGSIVDLNEREANKAFVAARREEIAQMIDSGDIRPLRNMAEFSSGRRERESVDWADRFETSQNKLKEIDSRLDALNNQGEQYSMEAANLRGQRRETETRLATARLNLNRANLKNLNDRNGEPFYVGNKDLTAEEMADVATEDEFGETVRDADIYELAEVSGISNRELTESLLRFDRDNEIYMPEEYATTPWSDWAEEEEKEWLIDNLSTEATLQLVLDKDFNGDKQALSDLIDEVFDGLLNYRIRKYGNPEGRDRGMSSGRRDETSPFDQPIDWNERVQALQNNLDSIIARQDALSREGRGDSREWQRLEDSLDVIGERLARAKRQRDAQNAGGFSSGRPDERQSFEDFARTRFEESGSRGSFENWMRRNEEDLSADWDNLQADMRGDGLSSGRRRSVDVLDPWIFQEIEERNMPYGASRRYSRQQGERWEAYQARGGKKNYNEWLEMDRRKNPPPGPSFGPRPIRDGLEGLSDNVLRSFSSGSRGIDQSEFSIRVGGDRYEGGKFENVSFYAPQDFVDRWAKQNAREVLSAQDMRVSARRGDTPDLVIARESTDELLGRIARSSRYDGNAERLQDDVNRAYRELSEQRRIEGQEAAMSEAFSSGARDGDGEMPDPFGPFSDRRIVEARMNGATLDELSERLRIPRTEVRRREQLFLHGLRDEKNSDRAIFNRRETGETLDSISQDLKISREEIRQRELRYRAKLRKAKEAPNNPLEKMQDGFSSGKEKKTREDVISEIQKTLIAMLETADPKDWSPPWSRIGAANNPVTGKKYSGVNPLILSFTEATKGYKSTMWATFKQWNDRGAKIKGGEKGTLLYRPTFKSVIDEETGKKKTVPSGYLVYSVFNLEQTTGLKESELLGEQISSEQRVADLEEGLMEVGAAIQTGGDSAYYSPSTDSITMPAFETFRDPESYYAVLAHEMVHWSGHSDRLNRPNLNAYGTPAYAQEELVAEIASAMILGLLGVTAEPREDHAQYLKGWLRALTEDPQALSKAFAEAEKAADFVIGKSPKLKAKSVASKADGAAPSEPALSSGRRLWTARERAENAFSDVMRDINENGSIAKSGARGSIGRNDIEKMIKSSYGVDADYIDGNISIPSDSRIKDTGMSPDEAHAKFLSAMRSGLPEKYTMDQDGPSTWAHSPNTGEGRNERVVTGADGKSPLTFANEFGLNEEGPAGNWELHTDSTERRFFTRGSNLGDSFNRWITHTTPDGKLVAYHEVVDGFISGDGEGQDIDFDYDFDGKLTPEFNSIEELDQYIDSYEKARKAFTDELNKARDAGDMERLSELLDDEMARSRREYAESVDRMNNYTLSSGARNVAISQVDAGKAKLTDDQWQQYNADIANVLKTDEPNFSSGRRTREDLIDPSEITNVREMMNRTDELGSNSRAVAGNLNYSKDPYDFDTIKAGSPVKFKYKGKDRTVYPTTLLAGKDGGVYFVGLDDEINQYRSFRLDKIEGMIDGARPPLNRRLARRGRADELSSGSRNPVERDATDRVPPMVQEKNEFLNKQDVMSENAQPSTIAENAFQLVEERERLIADLIKQNNIKTTDRTNITDLTDDEDFWDVLDDLDESIKNHIDWLDERQSEWEDRVGMVDFTSWRRETDLKNASNLVDEARFSDDEDDRRVALRDAIDALMEPRADGETRAIESASEITDAENPLEKARELLASEISVAEQEYRDFEARGENFSSEDVYPKRLRRPHEIANGAYGRDRYMSTPGLSSGRRVERMALDFEERGRLSKIMNEAANKFVIDSNGRRISGGPKVGNISENATRKPDGPWMLSFDKLRDLIRNGNGEELSTKDLAKLFGITESQAEMLDAPGAAIDQATVFSFFDIIPSTQLQSPVSEKMLRDVWGWDAYPYWYDPLDWDRGPLTRVEYDDLVDQKEMPDGLLFPADFDPYQEMEAEAGRSIIGGARALSATPQSKLFESKFGINAFLGHMGIPQDATEDEIRSALTVTVDDVEYIPTPDQMRRWRERGIPTGIVEQMVESGLIPNAGEVFGPIGEQFDSEIKRTTALQRIVDMAKDSGKMKSMRRLGLALGDQKLERTLATKPKFSLQTTGKADRNRVDRSEVERMLDNVNRAIGTEFTIDDFTAGLPEAQRQGFSSGRKAAEEIANVGDQLTAKLSGRSRPNRGAPARITPKMQDELIYWAKNKGSWSGFAKSLVKQLEANGFLTESQWSKLLNLHDSEVRKRFNKR